MNYKDVYTQCRIDLSVYGMCAHKTCFRKWYNPMRWIKGKLYLKRISPRDLYV